MTRNRRVGFCCAALLASAAPARSQTQVSVLPDVSVHLKAARYAPSDLAFRWDGWIGAGASLVRAHDTTVYFTADLETIIGGEKRTFDANQANYQLEAGVRHDWTDTSVAAVFHHVSRHVVDRPKTQAVDWNNVGVRATRRFRRGEDYARLTVAIDRTIQHSFVRYGWEFMARGDMDVISDPSGAAYVLAELRAVTEPKAETGRGGFLDATIEGGYRFRRERRALQLFAAYEHRNDVFVESREARNRALVGFRITLGDGESHPGH